MALALLWLIKVAVWDLMLNHREPPLFGRPRK
jgi:hypothetical protein